MVGRRGVRRAGARGGFVAAVVVAGAIVLYSSSQSSQAFRGGDGDFVRLTGSSFPCQWRAFAVPSLGAESKLESLDVRSPTDIWVAGEYTKSSAEGANWYPFVLHWDGAHWTRESRPGPYTLWPSAVLTFGARNTWWFAGNVAAHWDGRRWSTSLRLPARPTMAQGDPPTFASAAGLSPSDIWAVGSWWPSGALTVHWDGSKWKVIGNPAEQASARGPSLGWVFAYAHNDVWAVGERDVDPLFLHWNGTRWKVVPSPSLDRQYEPTGAASSGRTDIWVVTSTPGGQTLRGQTIHFDGSKWKVVKSPVVSDTFWFNAVAAFSPRNAWAVGYDTNGALIEHWMAQRGRRQSSARATGSTP